MLRKVSFWIPAFLLVAAFGLTNLEAAQTRNPPPPPTDPQLAAPADAPLNPNLPTLFIVGDSTARNGKDLGWGDHLAHYFDTAKINVANRARAGRSSRSYMVEGMWDKTLAEVKPGDFVLLQWGHNDGGDLGGAMPRGSLHGLGEETQDVPQTTGVMAGKTETVHTYGWYLRKYIADVRAKGATPMLMSLTVRDIWKPDASGAMRVERDMGYDALQQQLAETEHVPYIDMATVEADRLEKTGHADSAKLFPVDHTHTSAEGAELNAQSVVIALKKAGSPLVTFLNDKGRKLKEEVSGSG